MENISKSVIQAGVTVDITRKLEGKLVEMGAAGKGLHEKVTSIGHLIPESLIKKLRYVASVRNNLSHNDVVYPDDAFNAFVTGANLCLEDLDSLRTTQYVRADPPVYRRKFLSLPVLVIGGIVVFVMFSFLRQPSQPVVPVAMPLPPIQEYRIAKPTLTKSTQPSEPATQIKPVEIPAASTFHPAKERTSSETKRLGTAPKPSAKNARMDDGESIEIPIETARRLTEGLK